MGTEKGGETISAMAIEKHLSRKAKKTTMNKDSPETYKNFRTEARDQGERVIKLRRKR